MYKNHSFNPLYFEILFSLEDNNACSAISPCVIGSAIFYIYMHTEQRVGEGAVSKSHNSSSSLSYFFFALNIIF